VTRAYLQVLDLQDLEHLDLIAGSWRHGWHEQVRLPTQPTFADKLEPLVLDESTFRAAPPVERARNEDVRRLSPFRGRGVGTRNFIVILGTTSRTASFARQLAARLQPLARVHPASTVSWRSRTRKATAPVSPTTC